MDLDRVKLYHLGEVECFPGEEPASTVVRVFGFYLFFKKETLLFRVFLKVVVD